MRIQLMDQILRKWERSLGQQRLQQLNINIERRSFLANSLKAAAGMAILPGSGFLTACSPGTSQQQLEKQQPWQTFAAVQQQLFPNDDNGPDAKNINATAYLKFVLDHKDTDPDDREFIVNGIDWLDELCLKQFNNRFSACNSTQQQNSLSQIAKSDPGERWLSYLLLLIFEALLSDPVYGANPDGVGWQWLEHQPGFPRPPTNKRYMDLT
jgi:gluconate 2-dehydrogenase gamma chain